MSDDEIIKRSPQWLLRPLPLNAAFDQELLDRIREHAKRLPMNIRRIQAELGKVSERPEYDAAANLASAFIWSVVGELYRNAHSHDALLDFASAHMTRPARARVYRRLAKSPSVPVRRRTADLMHTDGIREVALPRDSKGEWSQDGWLHGVKTLARRSSGPGKRPKRPDGAPRIRNVGELRSLLGIKSERQLGYFLLATDEGDGPYTSFTIPKRDGRDRKICAPKNQLKWVQRGILNKILSPVKIHDAAHGFVTGRSIVTNAEQHVGAELVVKFDLTDFFPTIHYHRVMGMFQRLGYGSEYGRFQTDDSSRSIAPTLARLCVYAADPKAWGDAALPQGAPTSPVISNIVCRRLDARLTGLAKSNGGVYTRYADDLTFSFKVDELNLGRFRWWVDQICHQEGFFVNQKKFRVIRKSQRQTVTGIVVNDMMRIPREERRRFRAILHNCRKHGVESQAGDHPAFKDYLRGFASYISMVHPEEGAVLREEVAQLLGDE